MTDRATLLALADCVDLLGRFAGDGIAMGPEDKDDPAILLLDLSDAMGLNDFEDCAAALRARAAEVGE